jgi:hypothetical protein
VETVCFFFEKKKEEKEKNTWKQLELSGEGQKVVANFSFPVRRRFVTGSGSSFHYNHSIAQRLWGQPRTSAHSYSACEKS